MLEDMRDEALTKIVSRFQAFIRGYLMRKNYKKLQDQRVALSIIQRNIRKWLLLRLVSHERRWLIGNTFTFKPVDPYLISC